MALSPTAWPINTYTASNWTDWITSGASARAIKSATICNTTSSTITLSMRKVNSSSVVLCQYLVGVAVEPNKGYSLDADMLALAVGDKIQFNASAVGLSFDAAGV